MRSNDILAGLAYGRLGKEMGYSGDTGRDDR
jgi:hypothetical protein